ncbi:hypothetical protein, partial [Pectobacterium aroidearum]|uniref:hypothetical protein n=1 Tax=Pectobacterium aroidearum TaxID=1201031 RepID=UPI0030177C92
RSQREIVIIRYNTASLFCRDNSPECVLHHNEYIDTRAGYLTMPGIRSRFIFAPTNSSTYKDSAVLNGLLNPAKL